MNFEITSKQTKSLFIFGPFCTNKEFIYFRPFLYKISQNSASNLSGHSTFLLSYVAEYSIWQHWESHERQERAILSSLTSESIVTLPPFGPIEGQKWSDQISSQWASQKNRFALIYFGKIQFFPPCIWNLPFMSYRLRRIFLSPSQSLTVQRLTACITTFALLLIFSASC